MSSLAFLSHYPNCTAQQINISTKNHPKLVLINHSRQFKVSVADSLSEHDNIHLNLRMAAQSPWWFCRLWVINLIYKLYCPHCFGKSTQFITTSCHVWVPNMEPSGRGKGTNSEYMGFYGWMLPSWRLFLGFLVASNHKMNMPTLPMFIPSSLPRASIILMVFWSRPLTRVNLLGAFVVRLIFLGSLRGWGKRLDGQIPTVKDTHDHDHGDLNEVSVNVSHVLNV